MQYQEKFHIVSWAKVEFIAGLLHWIGLKSMGAPVSSHRPELLIGVDVSPASRPMKLWNRLQPLRLISFRLQGFHRPQRCWLCSTVVYLSDESRVFCVTAFHVLIVICFPLPYYVF